MTGVTARGASRRLRSLHGRIAVRTAVAVFVALNVAGAAMVVVVARTTYGQVEGVLHAVQDSLQLDARAPGEGEALCAAARTQPLVPIAGVADLYVEAHGPHGEVCRYGQAPALDPVAPPATVTQWFTGSGLPRAYPPGHDPLLVLRTPLAGGWEARIGGGLTAFGALARPLLLTLGLVGLLGAVAAVGSGAGVARSGLRPVRELTGVAERIARTEDLTTRIDRGARGDPAGDDEVDRLADAFNRMTDALSKARERQARLVADAGHELRTPLTSLRANVELLVRSEMAGRPLPADERSSLLGDLVAQLAEFGELVDDVVALAREEPSSPPAPVRLDETVRRALDRVRPRAAGRPVTAQLLPWLVEEADGDALERAVVNLLDNAVKFSPPDGRIDVRLAQGRLTVDDEGPGVPEDRRLDAFDRFRRGDDARSLPGSGLGLAIVADAARRHGGTARLETAPGGGTRAVLVLPGRLP